MAHIINNAATDAIKNGQSAFVGDSVLAGSFCNFLILGCCRVDDFVTGEVEGNGGVCRDGDVLRGISRQLDGDGCTFGEIIKSAEIGEGAAGDRNRRDPTCHCLLEVLGNINGIFRGCICSTVYRDAMRSSCGAVRVSFADCIGVIAGNTATINTKVDVSFVAIFGIKNNTVACGGRTVSICNRSSILTSCFNGSISQSQRTGLHINAGIAIDFTVFESISTIASQVESIISAIECCICCSDFTIITETICLDDTVIINSCGISTTINNQLAVGNRRSGIAYNNCTIDCGTGYRAINGHSCTIGNH